MFGVGLVETAEDFGTRARNVPECRELLDWLSVDFMEHGWSQKQMIRMIVTSATYRQSSNVSAEIAPIKILITSGWRGALAFALAEVVPSSL